MSASTRRQRCVAYLRVSTDMQAERGHGLDVQADAVRAWARSTGRQVAAWERDEGVSGTAPIERRAGLLRAYAALSTPGIDGLVVYRLDRLSRDLVLSESLLGAAWKLGKRVWSTAASEDHYLDPNGADLDPSRALIRQVLSAVAAYERAMVRLRLESGKARKRAAGGFASGGVPYGWKAEGKALVPDAAEQAALRRLHELHGEGLSLRAIAAALADEGHRPRRSQTWHPQTIRSALRWTPLR